MALTPPSPFSHPALILSPDAGTDDDLEYFLRECGNILGVANRLEPEKRDGKHILEYIFKQVVEFKKTNQD